MTDAPWPFPALDLITLRRPDGSTVRGPSGSPEVLQSYVSKYGAAPAIEHGTRQIVRLAADNSWIISPPRGDYAFEKAPCEITDLPDITNTVIAHAWSSIGFTGHRVLTEFTFSADGSGYSRHLQWGYGERLPSVLEAYWRYELYPDEMRVEWESDPPSTIRFVLRREIRVAGSLKDGSLSFYEATLTVGQHLFPPSSGFYEGWSREYWGTTQNTEGAS